MDIIGGITDAIGSAIEGVAGAVGNVLEGDIAGAAGSLVQGATGAMASAVESVGGHIPGVSMATGALEGMGEAAGKVLEALPSPTDLLGR